MKAIEITSLYQLRGAVENVSAVREELRLRVRGRALHQDRPLERWGADGSFGDNALWDEVHEWEKAIADFADEVQATRFPEEHRRIHGGD